MAKQIFIITQEGCDGCEEARQQFPNLPVLDIGVHARAERIADSLNLEYVPAFVEVEGRKVCLLDDNLKARRCAKL